MCSSDLSLDPSGSIFMLALDRRAGIDHIGEHHTGTTKHVVIQTYGVVNRHVVLNLDPLTDDHIIGHKDVLT